MKASRLIRYYYLRFIRLRGDPHELALGMTFGVFTGMMPIMPFQMALSVALALIFKGSKITAAVGTWISNPLNWYFLYYFSYKLGAWVLGMEGYGAMFRTIMDMVRSGAESMAIVQKIMESGGLMVAAFLVGGVIMGTVVALPSYFIFLYIFKRIKQWRKSGKS
ncbi:MAG: DUF2062 domain-containing protein [Deltaproteobacteria bacterium]|nr:DUF2062 domain-containing protein [Deltaproteobacteria bacterium]